MTNSGFTPQRNPYEGYSHESEISAFSTGQVAQDEPPKGKRIWTVNRSLGLYAGIFAITVTIYALGGVLWGVLRPTYTAYVEDAESASIAVESNTAFVGYAWFVVITGVLAAVIALFVFLKAENARGLLMLWWLGIVTALGSVVFLVFGTKAADLRYGSPADYADAIGQTFQLAPTISPGAAFAVAPFLAVCMYWCATFATPEQDLAVDKAEVSEQATGSATQREGD